MISEHPQVELLMNYTSERMRKSSTTYSLSLSHYSLCYCPQTLLSTSVPLSMTLLFVIPPSSPPFQSEQLHGGSLRVKLFSADREDINQMMHIRQKSVREEGRNMFTHFLLIALSVFLRLFCRPVFIHHSASEDALECPHTVWIAFPLYLFLRISPAFSCLLSIPLHTSLFIFIPRTLSKFGMT